MYVYIFMCVYMSRAPRRAGVGDARGGLLLANASASQELSVLTMFFDLFNRVDFSMFSTVSPPCVLTGCERVHKGVGDARGAQPAGQRPYLTERINQMLSPKSFHPQIRQLHFTVP